ncbi:hypothetical protein JL722_13517 [Aureococcus anophagefferens]|nr:hypothetical protein JL722_13517 [Aureococcus anophagefferens]
MAAIEEVFFDDFQFDLVVDSTADGAACRDDDHRVDDDRRVDEHAGFRRARGAGRRGLRRRRRGRVRLLVRRVLRYSYAGRTPGEMIFDAEFDFGEFTAPDEGAFDAEDTVLISEPVPRTAPRSAPATGAASASELPRRRRLRMLADYTDANLWGNAIGFSF